MFEADKAVYMNAVGAMKAETEWIKKALSNAFSFTANNFGLGNEMLILVTELTVNYSSARFIASKGCDEYFKYDKSYLLYERNKELVEEIKRLESMPPQERPSTEI